MRNIKFARLIRKSSMITNNINTSLVFLLLKIKTHISQGLQDNDNEKIHLGLYIYIYIMKYFDISGIRCEGFYI